MKKLNSFIALVSFLALFNTFAFSSMAQCASTSAQTTMPTSTTTMPMPMSKPMTTSSPTVVQPNQMQQMHTQMLLKNLGTIDQNYDLRVLNTLIQQQQQGMTIAFDAINKVQHPELKQYLQQMINRQQSDIGTFSSWRRNWYGY